MNVAHANFKVEYCQRGGQKKIYGPKHPLLNKVVKNNHVHMYHVWSQWLGT